MTPLQPLLMTPQLSLAEPVAVVPAAAATGKPLSPRAVLRQLPARLADFSAAEVATWAASTTLAPEVIECLRDNAVNGAVLETLSEADLKTMGLPRLASWLALWSQRIALQSALKGEIADPIASQVRPRTVAGSVTVSVEQPASPMPGRGLVLPIPRSCSGTLPPRARSPLECIDIPAPTLSRAGSGTCSARTVSVTRSAAPVKATICTSTVINTSSSWTPQKSGSWVSATPTHSVSMAHPVRSSSAVRARDTISAAAATPRSSSCIRTRIEYHAPHAPNTPSYRGSALPVGTVSAVPVVSAAPVGSVVARTPAESLSLHITMRPLESDRIRQAPPNRRVRSIERLDKAASVTGSSRTVSRAHSPRRKGSAPSPHPTESPPLPVVIPSRAAIQEALNNPILQVGASNDAEGPVIGAEASGETIFGEAVESWGRICSEMAKDSEEDFDNLQRQLNALFTDEQQKAFACVA